MSQEGNWTAGSLTLLRLSTRDMSSLGDMEGSCKNEKTVFDF